MSPQQGFPPPAQEQHVETIVASSPPPPPPRCPYFELEGLLAAVESGALAPLKGRWLVKLQARGGRLSRRQDLPPEAHWTAAELRAAATRLGDDYGLLFVALSYRWLTKEHPDPDGFHLAIVAAVARLYLGDAGNFKDYSPLVEAFAKANGYRSLWDAGEEFLKQGGVTDFALFWDFGSLFQAPRTEEQQRLFGGGLRASNVWYGHMKSVCWMQSQLPAGFAGAAYEVSGWCFVEAAMSAAVKVGLLRLDLGRRTERAMELCYGSDSVPQGMRLDVTCAGSRLPPPLPDQVQQLLETEKVFTNAADVTTVASLYRSFFETVASSLALLDFGQLGWGDAEAESLAAALPFFPRLATLDLSRNRLGEQGAKALAAALAVSASLTECNVRGNTLDGNSATLLAKIAREKRVMLFGIKHNQSEANFTRQGLGPVDAILIASDLAVSASLTSVWTPAHERVSLCLCTSDLHYFAFCLQLSLSNNRLCGLWLEHGTFGKQMGTYTAEGIIAIAEALKVTASLTVTDMRYNQLDTESATALANVAKEKGISLCGIAPGQTEANLRGSRRRRMEPTDAILLTADLAVRASLTRLDVQYNSLGEEGTAALHKAVEDRSGFELKL